MRKIILFFLIALTVDSRAALSLVSRETFQGVGTLSSGTPGNLGTVTGSFYKRAVGPRLTSDTTANSRGWSADNQIAAGGAVVKHDVAINSTAATLGTYTAWYFVSNFANNGSNKNYLTRSSTTVGDQLVSCGLDSSTGNFWYGRLGISSEIDSGIAAPVGKWFELRFNWQNTSANNYNIELAYRLSGSSTWVIIYTSPSTFGAGARLSKISSGHPNANSHVAFNGRYGMPSLYQLGVWSDRTALVSDVIDPPTTATTWYVNPATGSDTNDGVTPTSAWANVGKINIESQYCGLFPKSSYATGDTVQIDTTAANLLLGTASLNLSTQGLNVVQIGGGLTGAGELQAWAALANASFTPTSGTTKIYQITLTESNPSCVVWEADKWLAHPAGANFAAVQSTLESTAGSFWTDGTTLYLHPFDDSNPTTDGKIYTRSYNRGGTGISAVQMLAPDLHLDGLRIRKTCLARSTDNDPILGYGIQSNGAGGGVSLIENCHADYGAKHIFGFTDNATNRVFTVRDCQAEQGSPYTGAGGQTPWVDFSPLAGPCTNQTTYLRCVSLKNSGLIGSTAGQNLNYIAPWLSHNVRGGNQYSQITFTDCNFSTEGSQASISTSVLNFTSTRTTWGGGFNVGNAIATFDRCAIYGWPITAGASGSATVTNSIFKGDRIYGSGQGPQQTTGTLIYKNNTLDLSGIVMSDGDKTALLNRAGALNLTWQNNALIASSGTNATIVSNATSADTLTISYLATNSGYVLRNYNDGTTTADCPLSTYGGTGNFTNANLKLDATTYYPLAGSPVINAGYNVGPLTDYSGTAVFQTRNDIGTWEYDPTVPHTPIEFWRNLYFNTPSNAGVAADTYDYANDRLPNLLKYAVGLNPLVPGVLPISIDTDSGYLRLTIAKNPQASDVTYLVEVTDDLATGNWAADGTTIEVDTATQLRVRDNTVPADGTRRFLRLRVIRPE